MRFLFMHKTFTTALAAGKPSPPCRRGKSSPLWWLRYHLCPGGKRVTGFSVALRLPTNSVPLPPRKRWHNEPSGQRPVKLKTPPAIGRSILRTFPPSPLRNLFHVIIHELLDFSFNHIIQLCHQFIVGALFLYGHRFSDEHGQGTFPMGQVP